MPVRLNKYIAHAGVCSRRQADFLIRNGDIEVNGSVVTTLATQVDPQHDKISYLGSTIKPQAYHYFAIHKPKGFLCSSAMQRRDDKLVLDLFPEKLGNLTTVGRLDKNTTGLLIVTNDGDFAQQVMSPKRKISKEYLVKTKNVIQEYNMASIREGCRIDGNWTRPYKVHKIRKNCLKIVVREGKKHQIRIAIKSAGLQLLSLHRIRIGEYHLGSLSVGEYISLSDSDLSQITCSG